MTVNRLAFEAPYGCRWCGTEARFHGRRWSPVVEVHAWEVPPKVLILERMLARRAARRNAAPAVYHAVTAWASDYDGEEGIPFCAACKTEFCHRWSRIQVRLDQQRWGLPRHTSRHRKTAAVGGGWGGADLPF